MFRSRASSIIQSRRGRNAFPSVLGKSPDNPATDPDLRRQLNKLLKTPTGEKFSFTGTDNITYTYQWTATALSDTKTCQNCALGCKPGKRCGVVLDGPRIWQDAIVGQPHFKDFQVKTKEECTKRVVEWALKTGGGGGGGVMPPEIGISKKSDWRNFNCHIPNKEKCKRWIYGQGEGIWGLGGWGDAALIGAKGVAGEFITWVAKRISPPVAPKDRIKTDCEGGSWTKQLRCMAATARVLPKNVFSKDTTFSFSMTKDIKTFWWGTRAAFCLRAMSTRSCFCLRVEHPPSAVVLN